ncbi:MAG TPA: hypothetical protein VGK41_05440 [Solirubrobacterales bacterium]
MYPTRAELVAASANEQLTALTNEQQDALRLAAISAVENFTGQKFEPVGTEAEPAVKTLHGTGGTELYVPDHLEQLVELSVPGGALDLADVAISEHGNYIYLVPRGVSTWVERAMADSRERSFPRGRNTITVAGVWGWTDCPADVVTALRYDMEDAATAASSALAPSIAAWRKLGMDSMAQGPLSVQLTGRPAVLSPRASDVLYEAGLVWERIGEVV